MHSQQPVSLTNNDEFIFGLSKSELTTIVNEQMQIVSLDVPQASLDALSDGNRRALNHLVKATEILNDVFFKQDHTNNIRVKEAFEAAAAGGNQSEMVRMAHQLFRSFNGLEGINNYTQKSEPLRIFSDKELAEGRGFYPADLTKEELIQYLVEHPNEI